MWLDPGCPTVHASLPRAHDQASGPTALSLPALPAGETPPKLSDTWPGGGSTASPVLGAFLNHTSQTHSPHASGRDPQLGPLCPVQGHSSTLVLCHLALPHCPPGNTSWSAPVCRQNMCAVGRS